MKKALITTSIVAVAAGAGVWALGGWATVGLTFLVPLLFATGGLLVALAIGYAVSSLVPDSFKEGLTEGFNDLASKVA